MDIQDGWLTTARQVISPHHDTRPEQVTPRLLVIHNISLPPDSSVARILTSFFRARWTQMRIRFLLKYRRCGFPHIA